MKKLMMCLAIYSCAIAARGEIFQMDRKGDAIVEVKEDGGEYRITCKFKPQTKFDKAVNAKFNDAKGDSLCKKGLARYLKAATNDSLAIAGLYSAGPVVMDGARLCYSFAVPISGCKVANVASAPKSYKELTGLANPVAVASPTVRETTDVAPTQVSEQTVRSSSYLCVATYREDNGQRTTIAHKEYQGHDFKSPKDFELFCQQEFDRIRALGAANLREVRNFGK